MATSDLVAIGAVMVLFCHAADMLYGPNSAVVKVSSTHVAAAGRVVVDGAAVVADLENVAPSSVERDRWVQVTGTFAGVTDGNPRLRVDTIRSIPAPSDPYE